MLMVVFGAGASYDSYPSIPPSRQGVTSRINHYDDVRLPLAAHLFSNRGTFAQIARQFPECQPIIPFLRHVPAHTTVEGRLEELQKEAATNPRRHSQLAAIRHYLQFIIRQCEDEWEKVHNGITNFHTLLDEIEAWRNNNDTTVCLVTFNYDTIVESALSAVGVNITSMIDYVSHDYKLIKLHGSINWGRVIWNAPEIRPDDNDWSIVKKLVDASHYIRLQDEYRFLRARPIARHETTLLIPAIAIPVVQKQGYECPPEHLKKLDMCLPQITKLLVIGWRGNEKHFLDKLAQMVRQPIRVLIVSGSAEDATETANNLSKANLVVINGYQKEKHGFSRFVLDRKVQDFLSS